MEQIQDLVKNKMKLINSRILILLSSIIIFLSGCVGLGTFQTARTTEKGQIGGGIGIGRTRYGDGAVEAGLRVGIGDKIDTGVKLNKAYLWGNLLIYGDVKYQFLGDKETIMAGSGGFGIGIIPWESMITFHLPLYLSVHPCKYFALYINPRYVFVPQQNSRQDNILGITGGIKIGNKFGLFLEGTAIYNNNHPLEYDNSIQAGIAYNIK